ncbi:hypothetical protein [Actinokineospora iranica]|uniref:Uncharacterized protein n=1 Tax=Actinokineospora iranica TaxID=1271860 RepID=A0A1G6ZCF7_9PSEU|nr:hypothetical protein [Actinokineospora iranica]SDE00270.1 hypothetical protein SAMN05216174_12817 [Actinokineospora iranica]
MTSLPRKRGLLLLVAATGIATAFILFGRETETRRAITPGADLHDTVTAYAASLSPDGAYRPPSPAERRTLVDGLAALRGASPATAVADLAEVGFTVTFATDSATGRSYAMAMDEPGGERAWGLYVVDLDHPVRVLVEVPHPNYDLRTEEVGLALWRAAPGALLAISGTHRAVGNGAGDVAHRTDSMFHAVAVDQANRGVAQIQLHGFDDDSLPDTDVVLSTGTDNPGPTAKAAADRLSDAGLTVCRPWKTACGKLEGTRNKQGILAAEADALFLHVEMSRTVRDSREKRAAVVTALAVTR